MKPILAIIALSLLAAPAAAQYRSQVNLEWKVIVAPRQPAAPAAQPTDEQQQTQQQDAPAPDNDSTRAN